MRGLSHSEISGLRVICTSPELIAAYHVLRRLCEPRHPPYALSYFLAYLIMSRKRHSLSCSYFQLYLVNCDALRHLIRCLNSFLVKLSVLYSFTCVNMSKISFPFGNRGE